MTNETIYMLLAAVASAVITMLVTVAYWEYRMRQARKIPSEIVSGTSAFEDSERMLEWIRSRLHACRGLIDTDRRPGERTLEHVVENGLEQTYWMKVFLRAVNLAGCEVVIRMAAKRDRRYISHESSEEERNKFVRVWGRFGSRSTFMY